MVHKSLHRRNDYEKAGLLALAFRAGLACQYRGQRFAIQPASFELDRWQGTDLFIADFGRRKKVRFDLTSDSRLIEEKLARTQVKAKSGGRIVGVILVSKRQAEDVVRHPCFGIAFQRHFGGRDMKLITIERACPYHANRCGLAEGLLWLSNFLNAQLVKGVAGSFNMYLPLNPSLP